MKKYGTDRFKWDIVYISETVEELGTKEQSFIKFYNSMVPNGYNLTSGGEYNKEVSEETRKKLSLVRMGRILSKETKIKISEGRKGIKFSDLTKEKMSLAAKNRWKDPIYREQITIKIQKGTRTENNKNHMRDLNIGKSLSSETKNKIGVASQKRWDDPIYKKEVSESIRKGTTNLEHRKKHSELTKKLWQNQEYRKNHQKKIYVGGNNGY